MPQLFSDVPDIGDLCSVFFLQH